MYWLLIFSEVLDAQHVPGLNIPNIDFVNLAMGYGVAGFRVNKDEDFVQIFNQALASQVPTLIEVKTTA